MNLQGTGALVTGAGRGLGAALARELARRGARVVLVARNKAEIEGVAAGIRAAGGEAHALAADIGDKQAIYLLAGAAAALVGPIDVLIHNASTLGHTPLRLLLDTECEDFTRGLDVNLVGPFRLTKALAGSMALRGRGLVLHISSDAATSAYPGWGAYSASKAALDHLARVWAKELEDTGVRFIGVDPGEMKTRMHADAMPDADPATLADPAVVAKRIASLVDRVEEVTSGSRLGDLSRFESQPTCAGTSTSFDSPPALDSLRSPRAGGLAQDKPGRDGRRDGKEEFRPGLEASSC